MKDFLERKNMIKTLNDIVHITSGFAFTSKYFKDHATTGYPVIRIQNLQQTTSKFKYWELAFDEKYLVYKDDILISLSENIKVDWWKGPTGLLNQRVVKLTPKKGIEKNWLYYFLLSVTERISNLSKKSIISNVSVRDLKKIPVHVPSIQ